MQTASSHPLAEELVYQSEQLLTHHNQSDEGWYNELKESLLKKTNAIALVANSLFYSQPVSLVASVTSSALEVLLPNSLDVLSLVTARQFTNSAEFQDYLVPKLSELRRLGTFHLFFQQTSAERVDFPRIIRELELSSLNGKFQSRQTRVEALLILLSHPEVLGLFSQS